MSSEVLAKVIRGETVESIHRGHLIVIDGEGQVLLSAGDPDTVTFTRSAAKPFQAMPLLTTGGAEAFEFSDEEIALACGSHSGEARHIRVVQLMLEHTGLSEAHLRCGAHLPFAEKEAERMQREGEHPTQLHNNCSGKHVGMLAVAKHLGADLSTYDDASHPVQLAILEAVSILTGTPERDIAMGVDGCAAPNFAIPLAAMARGFLNLVRPSDRLEPAMRVAAERIVSVMIRFPELVGGGERLDTMLMQAAEGKIISKIGAEGVWLCGVLPSDEYPTGLAIALKIEDGDDRRARPVAAVAVLKKLGILTDDAFPELSPMPVKNRRGDVVGSVQSVDFIL
jgi:L-asparaginase II